MAVVISLVRAAVSARLDPSLSAQTPEDAVSARADFKLFACLEMRLHAD